MAQISQTIRHILQTPTTVHSALPPPRFAAAAKGLTPSARSDNTLSALQALDRPLAHGDFMTMDSFLVTIHSGPVSCDEHVHCTCRQRLLVAYRALHRMDSIWPSQQRRCAMSCR